MTVGESSGGKPRGNESAALRAVIERLRSQFPELTLAHIEAAVSGCYDEFDASPIRDFVPVLVERGARDELRDPTHTDRADTPQAGRPAIGRRDVRA